jgi:ADP-heptose:LPS heptosyltransferase
MLIQNRNLFRATRFILLKLPLLFKFLARFRPASNNLLIIKTDAIGDYILFRNFLEVLRASDKYKNYKITLLGNELWQDIALKYDYDFVDYFIFIRKSELYEKPLATLKLGWRLFKNNYQVVLQPSYTRQLITDGLAALTAANHIIGFESDNEGITPNYKLKTDRFYTQRLTLPANNYFELSRSAFFFESVLGCPVNIYSPYIPVNKSLNLGVVILTGAGVSKRRWEKEKFLELIKLICLHTSHPVYLAGRQHEAETGDYLMQNLSPKRVQNLIGQTTLPQLIDLIGNAALVIANETSAIHIAAATKTKSVCILGGGHFERFAPYPAPMVHNPVCVSEKMACYNCNWACKFAINETQPFPCVSAVTVEKIWDATRLQLAELPDIIEQPLAGSFGVREKRMVSV